MRYDIFEINIFLSCYSLHVVRDKARVGNMQL